MFYWLRCTHGISIYNVHTVSVISFVLNWITFFSGEFYLWSIFIPLVTKLVCNYFFVWTSSVQLYLNRCLVSNHKCLLVFITHLLDLESLYTVLLFTLVQSVLLWICALNVLCLLCMTFETFLSGLLCYRRPCFPVLYKMSWYWEVVFCIALCCFWSKGGFTGEILGFFKWTF